MRDSGFVSTGPNFAKSTCGHGSRLSAPPPLMPPPARAAGRAPLIACFTKSCTSSCRMRPFGPVPLTCARSTPSSRAKLRTDGDACARLERCVVDRRGRRRRGSRRRRRGRGCRSRCGSWRRCGGAAAAAAAAGAAAPAAGAAAALRRAGAAASSIERSSEPSLTLSPTLTLTSLTVPADGDGTSIVALSRLERDERILGLHRCRPA